MTLGLELNLNLYRSLDWSWTVLLEQGTQLGLELECSVLLELELDNTVNLWG